MSVVVETTLGDITVDLYVKERPRACINFLKLCKMKYYNFNLFHTVSRDFIAQTGDPTGSRNGGESIWGTLEGLQKRYFEAETVPRIKHTAAGLVSFVGAEDKMLGSQFFFTLAPDLTYLDERHCVFGYVAEGHDVLDLLNETICDTDHRPYKDVRITHTVILDDPFPDPSGLAATGPPASPEPTPQRMAGGRIAPDEEIDETEGKTMEEITEIVADREAKARATILEMVGDIPDADIAPPENVLFVCKLNPVTNDDDLEILFSRFGKIVTCEVIRDKKTGDSLQYAFVEFAEQKSCEDAYFKMDNVLIDDRRIHVDFSQSVAKVKWLGKGRGVRHYDDKGRPRKTDAEEAASTGNGARFKDRRRNDRGDDEKFDSKNSDRNRRNFSERNYQRPKYGDSERGGGGEREFSNRNQQQHRRRDAPNSGREERRSARSKSNSSERGNIKNEREDRRNDSHKHRYNVMTEDRSYPSRSRGGGGGGDERRYETSQSRNRNEGLERDDRPRYGSSRDERVRRREGSRERGRRKEEEEETMARRNRRSRKEGEIDGEETGDRRRYSGREERDRRRAGSRERGRRKEDDEEETDDRRKFGGREEKERREARIEKAAKRKGDNDEEGMVRRKKMNRREEESDSEEDESDRKRTKSKNRDKKKRRKKEDKKKNKKTKKRKAKKRDASSSSEASSSASSEEDEDDESSCSASGSSSASSSEGGHSKRRSRKSVEVVEKKRSRR